MNKKILALAALSFFWIGGVLAQASPETIRNAHGANELVRTRDFLVTGTVERIEPGETSGTAVAFTLKVSGDRSRLQLGDRTFVRQGNFGQWWDLGSHRSTPKRSWEGVRQVYLLPFFAVEQLEGHYQPLPDQARVRYGRSIHRRVHYGHHDKTPVVELDFDPGTLLLSQAVFGTESGRQSVVNIWYRDYRRIQGIAVPSAVIRQVGDGAQQRFTISAIDFAPALSEADFQIDY